MSYIACGYRGANIPSTVEPPVAMLGCDFQETSNSSTGRTTRLITKIGFLEIARTQR